MPKAAVNGIQIYFEEAGSGTPLLFIHEFGGDYRSWESQMRFFSRRYRCITFSARGYKPSDVPDNPEQYSQDAQIADVVGLLDHLGIRKAHLCGLSMGANCTLYTGLKHSERCLSLTIAGGGYGSHSVGSSSERKDFHKQSQARAQVFLTRGTAAAVDEEGYAKSPHRIQLFNKDQLGWETFRRQFLEHDPKGSAYTLLGVQSTRPNIMELGDSMKKSPLPALVILGDEDTPGFEASIYIKRCMPRAGLAIFPRAGHAVNLEDPELFNRTVLDFLTAVDCGGWKPVGA